jgi:hypothetical protein
MSSDEKRGKAKSKGKGAASIDPALLARFDTELRNALSGREAELATAVLGRVVGDHPGAPSAADKRSVDAWFAAGAQALADESWLAQRVGALSPAARTVLALLAGQAWWSRAALVQAVSLARGDHEPAAAIAEVLSKWPVLLRTNAWTRAEELGLFRPIAERLAPLVVDALAVGHAAGERLPTVGLGQTLLALALFPGIVAHRRPRVTRSGELHGADATKIERALGESRGLYATWEKLGAFEEVDGALAPIAPRVKALLDDPGGLVASFLRRRLGDVGWSLASIAAAADEAHEIELGAALLSLGLRGGLTYELDVASLAARVERNDFAFAPLMTVDASRNAYAIPADVRAAIRGEPLSLGATANGYVQPNYEVVLPPGVPLGATFVVGCAAELIHLEAVARLRITKESVLAARAVGLTAQDIVAALEAVAGARAVPAGVRHAVEEWGSSVGEARIRTAVLLEVHAAPALLDQVASTLARDILDRPTPGLFVLARAPNTRELAALRTLGVLTRAAAPAGARPADAEGEQETKLEAAPWPLVDARDLGRDLRAALDPHRVLAQVEASRPQRGAAANGPTSHGRGALDPDEGAERPLPESVESALTQRREEWAQRRDWLLQLSTISAGVPFRRAAATAPGPLCLAIRRASDPNRLSLEVARLVAESSVRRTAD